MDLTVNLEMAFLRLKRPRVADMTAAQILAYSGAWQSPTTKRASKKQNDLHAVNNTIAKTNIKYPYPAEIPPQSCRLLEWILLKDPPDGVIPNTDSDELFATIQENQFSNKGTDLQYPSVF
ncbi:hypothetical protein N7516_004781 [Penicillium verrucosum]|uniref:uncharacterized protein n=1 Tax=Penicillium verrucosum TaxID=60171 RepID=UPI002545646C|nr:uncharacterized protein N7516_004781 [Penicillium verrucosum]KAJ5944613.1 hypothetical protein N7516_004781 [Penicillium verrucosum]